MKFYKKNTVHAHEFQSNGLKDLTNDGKIESYDNSSGESTDSGFLPTPKEILSDLKPYEKLIWIRDNSLLSSGGGEGTWVRRENEGKIVGLYKVGEEIGSGTFAKVKIGQHILTREKVALKIIQKSQIDSKMEKLIPREINSMEILIHPCLIRLYEVIETQEKWFLVCELARGGDLRKRLKLKGKLTEESAKNLYRQIVAGISFMHAKGLVHRDIKADNIFFFSPTHVKVGDFGFSTRSKRGLMLMTFCGSPPYAAPELFTNVSYEGFQVDVWALGILLYYMVKGTLPFKGNTIPTLKKAILSGKYDVPSHFSPLLEELLELALEQKPSKRGTISEIVHHPWLRVQPRSRRESMIDEAQQALSTITSKLSFCGTKLPSDNFHHHNRILLKKPSITGFPNLKQIEGGYLPEEERKTLETLNEIGISYNIIEANRPLGLKSPIMGIYRIVLHRYQIGPPISIEYETSTYSYFEDLYREYCTRTNAQSPSEHGKPNSPSAVKVKSKACTIL